MIDNDPIGTAGRETARIARLGAGPLVCFLCGEADPVTLIPKTSDWLKRKGVHDTLFEKHHVAGEAHDAELTVLICRNCHAKATEGLLQAGVSMKPEPDPIERVAAMLDARAVFLETEAASDRRMAELLRKSPPRKPE